MEIYGKSCPNCHEEYLELDIGLMQEKFGSEWWRINERDWLARCYVCGNVWTFEKLNLVEDTVACYAAAVSAIKNGTMHVSPAWVKGSRSQDEALGFAIRMARETFTTEEGFHSHNASVTPIYRSDLEI